MFDLTVIIPTFNEERNIRKMIEAVNAICTSNNIHVEILVVDDNSPDKTSDIVRDLQSKLDNICLLERTTDHGLSQSLYDGMKHAQAQLIQCIDCDFSHPPEMIPDFYRILSENKSDMVIGSRYIPGGSVVDWPLKRHLLSNGAAVLGRVLIPHVRDSGSGFFALNSRVLQDATLKPRGFRMGFEILGKGNWSRVTEIPICFKDRVEGQSKMRPKIIIDYLKQWINIVQYNLHRGYTKSNIIKSWKIFLHIQS